MNRLRISTTALAVLLAVSGSALAQDTKRIAGFGILDVANADTVKAQAQAWLKDAGKTDAATTAQFEAIWKQAERPILDRLADSIALGDADAAKLLAEARDQLAPAPQETPDVFKNEKLPAFVRANLGLAYARALNNRRVHEEALAVLQLFKAEQVVDPATYLFNRAVAEFSMLMKDEANRTIRRLLDEAGLFAPERFKAVAMLMQLDMLAWKAKDLSDIARKMRDVERRLDLARGGKTTQEKQKDILARLDEVIKKLENQQKQQQGDGQCNGGQCPSGGQKPGSGPPSGINPPSAPATASAAAPGPGRHRQRRSGQAVEAGAGVGSAAPAPAAGSAAGTDAGSVAAPPRGDRELLPQYRVLEAEVSPPIFECGEDRRFGFFFFSQRPATKTKNPKRRFSPHSKFSLC